MKTIKLTEEEYKLLITALTDEIENSKVFTYDNNLIADLQALLDKIK